MPEGLRQFKYKKEAEIFVCHFGCAIPSTGVKWARLKIMYTTDESDLGSSDSNPPSKGGWHAFKLSITVT